MKIIRVLFFILGFSAMAYVAVADEMKNTETVIASESSAITGAHTYPFTLYIGDNISGVTSPLKSLTFIATGVYTSMADESVTFMIDNDGVTSITFTLPNTGGVATPFNIEYKVPVSKINPTSAGSYSYNLNFDSANATIYGLGIKMKEAHRYIPPTCPDGDAANQKMKTTETVIASENLAISSTQSYPVTFYIGDNLTGVTNPVKSVVFNVTGVYTGLGSITLNIDGNGSKQFDLPDVGATPTPFDIAYTDSTNTINPASAGSYGYTLGVNPSGVTIYGLGIKMNERHQYTPPACGGFPPFGDLVSSVFDSTENPNNDAAYNSVMWKGTLGGPALTEGHVRFQFAAADSSSGPWNYIGGDTCSGGDWFDPGAPDTPVELRGKDISAPVCVMAWNNKRYFRYKVEICSSNCTDRGTFTPTVDDVVVNWAP